MHTDMSKDDTLADFDARSIVIDGLSHYVYVAGQGPGVIVMTEMPGISPQLARFARWVRAAGFRVYMPSLFGQDGAVPQVESGVQVFRRTCLHAEFRGLAENRNSPILDWLRGLARLAHEECGGVGVGAIGMCFTGNFALSMMLEPAVRAPVVCQPSLPMDNPAGLNMPAEELARVRTRLEQEDLSVLAYRFSGDRHCRAERFEAYANALGPRFIQRVLPDSAANPNPPPFFAQIVASPHSVVTAHLVDELGHPTIMARDEILGFLIQRLRGGGV